MKLLQYKEYLVTTVDTDGLVLQHQGISSYSAEYGPMHFQLFMVNPSPPGKNGSIITDNNF